MRPFHILNGDCIAENFPKSLEGEIIIWREALVDGPLPQENFFNAREKFISENYQVVNPDYNSKVILEFNKIQNIPEDSEVYFWFEDDLFCQVNFWFLISVLKSKNIQKFRIFPTDEVSGFAYSTEEDLLSVKENSKLISDSETELISTLWKHFQNQNLKNSYPDSEMVRNLPGLIKSNENRFNGFLNAYLKELSFSYQNFNSLFTQFQKDFPIYGFGDLQVKNLLKSL